MAANKIISRTVQKPRLFTEFSVSVSRGFHPFLETLAAVNVITDYDWSFHLITKVNPVAYLFFHKLQSTCFLLKNDAVVCYYDAVPLLGYCTVHVEKGI